MSERPALEYGFYAALLAIAWLLLRLHLGEDGWQPTPLPARVAGEIAFDLGVTEATIKAHLTSVFRKLGVHNRTQAVILAQSIDL